ncbi:MAG: diguanylate cyclase [Planctomycetaceae bacterium]|nr:diguanylate cyclase [Planctomycetaceae bacterium]
MKTEENTLLSANILVVDDDPAILRLLTHLLEQGGHRVRTAMDGNQCLQMILQDCPDVLITDWMMPGLDGLELCRRIRQLHNRKVLPHYTYILLLTAQSGKKFFIEGLESGADDFIEKSTASLSDLRIEIKARLKAALRTRKLEIDLEFAAKYDALTLLLNRVTFFELAQVIWERSIKNKFPLSTVMFDCDFFKRINDIHGHLAGDAVLREMASILKSYSRSSDIICRYGGEEFCVLLPGCNEKTAWNWAERIRRRFETNPIKHSNFEISITVSFGVAERMEDTAFLDQQIERADQALLFAKESGRNRCIRFSETIASETENVHGTCDLIELFSGVTAGEVMIPFTLSISPKETVASVIDFFLRTRIESLPVIDDNNHLIGMVSEKNLIPLIGNLSRWQEPIGDLVTPNVISYPVETPLKIVFDFLCRISARQILLVQGKTPVGFINRTPLLRWLRNRWAVFCGHFNEIVPIISVRDIPVQNLKDSIEVLMKELAVLDETLSNRDNDENWEKNRNRIVALISQCQDVMDQVLKYSASHSEPDSENLSPFASL